MVSFNQTLSETIYTKDGFGNSNAFFIYDGSNWIQIGGIKYFKIIKRLNQISQFQIDFSPLASDKRTYIKEFAKVMFFSGGNLILKGRIQKVSYQTAYSAHLEGYGLEAVILDREYQNITRSPNDPDRVQYDNISAQTIAKELLSVNADGSSPWIMQPRSSGLFGTDYGPISIRFEYANTLTALGSLTDNLNYEWWVDHDPISYTNDYFNIASIKGNQAIPDSARTFIIGRQCRGSDYQRDVTNVANYIKAIGYGDGINQLFTETYNASSTYTTLSADISDTVTTIGLTDASSFANSGTIRIAQEQITYTGKSSNNLTGCTRGANGTIAKIHRNRCFLEKYVAIGSPEVGSSIYLLKDDHTPMSLTITNKDIRDESTLELVASNELLNRMTAIERINVIPNNPNTVIKNLSTGDLVNIQDSGSSLNDNFRVVGITYENNYGALSVNLECSNRSLTFIEQMQKERQNNQNLQKYMQGSTNVYVVHNVENCDNGYGCIVKTYIPAETVAINHVMLSYDVSSYRIYNTTTADESAHTHDVPIPALNVNIPSLNVSSTSSANAGGSSIIQQSQSVGNTYSISSSWTNTNTWSPSSTITAGIYVGGGYTFTGISPGTNAVIYVRLKSSSGSYYPSSSGIAYTFGNGNGEDENLTYFISAPENTGPYSYTVQSKTSGGTYTVGIDSTFATIGTHSHPISGQTTGSTTTTTATQTIASEHGSAHHHGTNYAISTGTNSVTTMSIYIDGVDRTTAIQSQIGHTLSTTSTESEIDITQWITSVGSWHTIEVRPNGTCRISSDVWNQIFIEST